MNPIKLSYLSLFLTTALTACNNGGSSDSQDLVDVTDDGYTNVNTEQLQDNLSTYPLSSLSETESSDLAFMREEEKLARDVYDFLYDVWNAKIFDNISDSEQTHTDAVLSLLERYSLADPATGNAEGVFTDTTLQTLYDELINDGSASLINALQVGAAIEEIDLIDLQEAVDRVEDNDDIVLVYENLMKGSRNHLRAFVNNLSKQGINYVPQYLDQGVYDSVISADIEKGSV